MLGIKLIHVLVKGAPEIKNSLVREENVCFSNDKTFYEVEGIILCKCPANERCYIVMSSLIGWAHVQNDPCSW